MSSMTECHHLDAPARFGWRQWYRVLFRVVTGIGSDNLSLAAAGCAFYAMLSMVPGMTILLLVYGLVSDPLQVEEQLTMLNGIVPPDVARLMSEQLQRVARQSHQALGWGLVVAATVALWSSSAATKALIAALNIAYHERERRNFIVFNLLGLGFTFAGILALAAAIVTIVVVPAALAILGLNEAAAMSMAMLRWPIIAAFVMLGLALLYRFGPSRSAPKFRWISVGSVVAMVLWLGASILFSYYVGNIVNYNATFGSLGAIIIVLLWLYISAFAIIIGAKLNSEIELETSVDTTTGEPRPMGQRGAFVADNVAPYPREKN
ncbi:MAG: YihY/virulence factor BrkB family protein [Geminicoccaceae bacterium]|nr:YihY/virulence factor BrkB family protein [Geminicoccaceae bacterium]MCB9945154.1 YihY/virulence factor BrkB family protein [Geminicoccaceae bacterium]